MRFPLRFPAVVALGALLIAGCGGADPVTPGGNPGGSDPPPTGVSLPGATLGAGGGVVAYTTGALSGFSLTVPAAAFPATTSWNVSYRPASNIPRTDVINPVSPIIRITGSATSYAKDFLTLTIPATVPAGAFPVIVMRDPASGAIEVMPTVDYDDGYVTGVTRHLNAGFFMKNLGPVAGSSRQAGLRAGGYDIEVFATALSAAQLALDVDTGFRPRIDNWEFANPSVYVDPDGICEGMVISAMWYYANVRKGGGPQLWDRFTIAKGIPLSDRAGIRWGGVLNLAQNIGATERALSASYEARKNRKWTAAAIRYDMLRAMLLVTRLPQLVVVATADETNAHALLAFRSVGGRIAVADPNLPFADDASLGYTGAFFEPYQMVPSPNTTRTVPMEIVIGVAASAAVDMSQLPSQWPKVLDGTIDAESYPVTSIHTKHGRLGSDTLYNTGTSSSHMWLQCATCQGSLMPVPPENAPLTGPQGAMQVYWSLNGAPYVEVPGQGATGTRSITWNLSSQSGKDTPFGLVALGNSGDQIPSWIDWRPMVLRQLAGSITPTRPSALPGGSLTLTFRTTPEKLPKDVDYRWTWGDETARTTKRNDPQAVHVYETAGTYALTAEALDIDTGQPLVIATTTVHIGQPVWQLESATLVSAPLPAAGIGSESTDTLINTFVDNTIADLHQTPAHGLIFSAGDPDANNCLSIILEHFPTGTPSLTEPVPDAFRAILGSKCNLEPDLTATLTMGPLGNGTIVGNVVTSPNQSDETITVPGGSINATMTGTTLQGTFVWLVRYSTGTVPYTVSFRAVQVVP